MTGPLLRPRTAWAHLPSPTAAALRVVAEREIASWSTYPPQAAIDAHEARELLVSSGWNPGACVCLAERLVALIDDTKGRGAA